MPITVGLFYVLPAMLRLPLLCVASSIFYAASGLIPFYFMVAAVVWGFVTAFVIALWRRGIMIWLGISVPLLILFAFKYLDFVLNTVAAGPGARDFLIFFLSVVLPAGISFYTFQIVAYSIDVYDGTIEPERNFFKFYAFVSLFPQLIAGPIVRYRQIRDQLTMISTEQRLRPDLITGLKFICVGLFGKIFFADFLGTFLSNFNVETNTSAADAAFNVLAYSFQIYYDFWAYSIIAIGLGKLLCIDLPINFREPYLSPNPREFWRRWHMTLSYWLRDYAYLRLGGNKVYVRNILIVFLLVGLWHGAGWNFVAWGGYHGILVLTYHASRKHWDRLPHALQVGTTFTLVTLGWPLFQMGFEGYVSLIVQMFSLENLTPSVFGAKHWLYVALVAAFTFLAREKWWLYNEIRRPVLDWPVTHAGLAMMAILFLEYRMTFIYFRF
ncbi:MAG: MBOAT family O-acyltransferase [Alphaproteobacteria bacterium]|nr:MBOAT family O-acyltransferase [Alphaproteobacteria bacterium]